MKMKIYHKICILLENRNAQKLGFPLLNVSDEIIKKFKNTVKGNKNISDREAIKKINRDMYSGEELYQNEVKILIGYGYLRIHYSKKLKMIYDIQNYRPYSDRKCGRINQEIRNELNKIYGLEDK